MMPADLNAASAALLSWLLTYAIHSTILLAGAAAIAWRFADRHAWLDLVWKAALVGPVITASLSLSPTAIPLGGRWQIPAATLVTGTRAPSPAPAVAAVSRPGHEFQPGSAIAVPAPGHEFQPQTNMGIRDLVPTPQRDATMPTQRDATGAKAAAPQTAVGAWQPVVRQWPAIAVMSWLAIAALGLARYGWRLFRVYRAVGAGQPVTTPELLDTINTLGGTTRQRSPVRLTTSDVVAVPLALAGRRIVLPTRFLEELDGDQQRAALAHEMAHVVRRDPAWRIVAGVVEHALFFQPLNRVARIRLGDSAEFLSDQWAVQQTQSPLALARCLEVVASWSSSASDEFAVGVSAMARKDSPMIRRVTHILSEPVPPVRRPRLLWLAIPLMLVAIAAPRVTATQLPAMTVNGAIAAVLAPANAAHAEAALQVRDPRREPTAAEIARAQADLRVYRPARPADSFEDRWRWALDDARRQGFADFWIAYSLDTDVHAQDIVMSDTRGNTIVSNGGVFNTSGPPLTALLPDGRGNLVVLLRYRGGTIDQGGYRSAKLGFDFARTPVFWLGYADETESFNRVRALFEQARNQEIQAFMIELASMHSNANVVVPFLARLVEPSRPPMIRQEAAEGFGHQHDPRSVEILLRLARTDADAEVRVEAAETIGEVQVPQSIPALSELVSESADAEVQREAAEAFGEQPGAQAIPAIERALTANLPEDVLGELVEALGDIQDASVLALLVQTANTHPNRHAQQEAVETLGDIDEPGAVDALARIAMEHDNVAIQREAVETLGDRSEDAGAVAAVERILRDHPNEEVQAEAIETLADLSGGVLHQQILALAASGTSARIRREAIEAIADALEEIADAQALDTAERVLERAIFDDVDQGVREEALDAADHLPNDRALRLLRAVIDRHPNAGMRREAEEHLRERQQ